MRSADRAFAIDKQPDRREKRMLLKRKGKLLPKKEKKIFTSNFDILE